MTDVATSRRAPGRRHGHGGDHREVEPPPSAVPTVVPVMAEIEEKRPPRARRDQAAARAVGDHLLRIGRRLLAMAGALFVLFLKATTTLPSPQDLHWLTGDGRHDVCGQGADCQALVSLVDRFYAFLPLVIVLIVIVVSLTRPGRRKR